MSESSAPHGVVWVIFSRRLVLFRYLVPGRGGWKAGIIVWRACTWPAQHGSVRVVRLLMWQLRGPGEGVPSGPGRCCKEPSFRSPTVSLSLHSIGQASH